MRPMTGSEEEKHRVEGRINFILGEIWHGWPVQRIEPVDLKAGSESKWWAPREAGDLTMYSGSATVTTPPSEPGVSCVLEQRRERDLPRLATKLLWWLSRRSSLISRWRWVTVLTQPFHIEAGKHRAEFGFDSPVKIAPGDHLRVKIVGVGEDAPGGGALISLKTDYTFA